MTASEVTGVINVIIRLAKRENLIRHRNVVHDNTKNYKRDQCGHKLPTKGHLKGRTKVVHGKIKKHKCTQCGYCFGNNGNLNKHMYHVHSFVQDGRNYL